MPRFRNVERRRVKKLSWTEHITNEEVLEIIGGERALIPTIRKRQKCAGHTLKGDSTKNGYRIKNGGKENKQIPGQMMLDLTKGDGYGKLKEQREDWPLSIFEPAYDYEAKSQKKNWETRSHCFSPPVKGRGNGAFPSY